MAGLLPEGIAPLVELVRNGEDAQAKAEATRALWRKLAASAEEDEDEVAEAIAQAGGIAALIELARSGDSDDEEAKESAANALADLARNHALAEAIAQAGGIAALVELMVRSGSENSSMSAADA
eukprot:7183931-Pyramimonas_sp.AAC.1